MPGHRRLGAGPVYAGSGYTAERDQTLQEGDNFTHYVAAGGGVISSAKQAGAFFTDSAQQWPACHQYTHTQSGSEWAVGPVSNTNGTLSTIATQQNANAPGWACGRALAHETTSLSTSTHAAPTPRTRLSTSPTRSPPKCPLNVPCVEVGETARRAVLATLKSAQIAWSMPRNILTGSTCRPLGRLHA